MLHKDTAGRISEFLKNNLLKARGEGKLFIPSSLHCYLHTFCCLHISKNIMLSALATQQTGEYSENVLFMSLKALYHQCRLHYRHKDNVHKSQMNEKCYKLRKQWFLASVLPHSLWSERNTFSLPRRRPKIMLLSSWNSWICVKFEGIVMYVL